MTRNGAPRKRAAGVAARTDPSDRLGQEQGGADLGRLSAPRSFRATRSSCRTCPQRKLRRGMPTVEAALAVMCDDRICQVPLGWGGWDVRNAIFPVQRAPGSFPAQFVSGLSLATDMGPPRGRFRQPHRTTSSPLMGPPGRTRAGCGTPRQGSKGPEVRGGVSGGGSVRGAGSPAAEGPGPRPARDRAADGDRSQDRARRPAPGSIPR